MYWDCAADVVPVYWDCRVLVYSWVHQAFWACEKVFVVSVLVETALQLILNVLHVNAYFLHSLLTALLQLWNTDTLVPHIWHPTPPFLWLFLKNDHLSHLLIKDVFSSGTFFFMIAICTVLPSKITIFFKAKGTVLDMID